MRKPGPPAEWERLRKRAVQAVREGQSPSVVAKVLGVHRVTVQRWLRQARAPGGLDARPVVRTPLLTDEQLPRLEALLLEGASKHGWPNDLWTAARVAALIRRHFGVTHHPEHVRKVLKRRLIAQGVAVGEGETLWEREPRGTAYRRIAPKSGPSVPGGGSAPSPVAPA